MTGSDREAMRMFEALSAVADGEADAQAVEQACASWRHNSMARVRWHAYHLIGDVLRSDELGAAKADELFLQRVRERLAAEPVVLAPASLAGDVPGDASGLRNVLLMRGRRRMWGAPIAVAAGFVAMAGLLVAVRQPAPDSLIDQQVSLVTLPTSSLGGGAESSLAQGLAPANSAALTGQSDPVLAVSDNVLRDAKLDRYLAAHQEFSGAAVLGESSGFLRSVTYEGPAR
ncbi:sigma-E factor negative regulatory protein [Aquabacterium sp.]|uniref:sigma-E factor negative regulatory protein n=1 Tax=Aquabacterium sp. TaxID=1872578 RepID=UPI0035ADA7DD